MDLISFIAESAQEAAAQVRERLGPTAVVVEVRPLPPKGRGWIRKPRPRFEILAYAPDSRSRLDVTSDAPAVPGPAPLGEGVRLTRSQGAPASTPLPGAEPRVALKDEAPALPALPPVTEAPGLARSGGGAWRIGAILEASGFMAPAAQRVLDQLRRERGEAAPDELAKELELARATLSGLWRRGSDEPAEMGRPHVLVGAPGVGKTTCLCKWLTQSVLSQGRKVRVWRLDGSKANSAEMLSVYGEVLGVAVERAWKTGQRLDHDEMALIDLPGVDWRNSRAMDELERRLAQFPSPVLHLVVSAAYDVPLLLAQVRAFARLRIADLVVSHLDEETRWGKVWNLVLGTNYSVRYLSAGQNIPGEFLSASPEVLFRRQFPA